MTPGIIMFDWLSIHTRTGEADLLHKINMLRFLALSLAVFLAACSEVAEDELRFGLSSAPINLDPRFATDAASSRINRLIYDQLVDFDNSYAAIPSLAEWEAKSAREYRFSIVKGRSFPDGSNLTAWDIKATYDSILDPDSGSPHRGSLSMIDNIEVLDEKRLTFKLNKQDLLFPGRLVIGILPMKLLEQGKEFHRNPVGSGDFEFISWPEDGVLKLVRRHDNQHVALIEVKKPTVRVLKLLRGEIDMLQNDLPFELVAHLSDQDAINVIKGRGSNFTYLGFNLQDEDTSNLKLRQAIAHALNRDEIIEYVMGNAAGKASALLPPDHWAGLELPFVEYNPDKARRLIKEAGYVGGKRPSLVYKTSSNPFRIRLATVIQTQLKDVGIDVDLRSYDWGTFYSDIKAGRFQMFSLSWVGIKTPDIFRYVFHSESIPPNGANRGRFLDEATDHLIDSAEAAADIETQAKYYKELQSHLLETLPYVPLWYEDHVFAAREGITGYTLARDGNYDGLKYVTKEASSGR